MDPTISPLCDAVSFSVCDDSVYAYGGATPEIIWRLHFATRTWSAVQCSGAIPPPRRYHAAVTFARHLLLSGGEPLNPISTPSLMPYYELLLDTFTWMRVETFGDIPLNRSHHTCAVAGSSMVLFGGKPVTDTAVTNEHLDALHKAGFYDVFILDIVSRAWRAVAPAGPAPQLWGHSAATYGDRYLIVYGGLDVSHRAHSAISLLGGPHRSQDPPIAVVSNRLFVLDLEAAAWWAVTPAAECPPLPRALHAAHVDGEKMYVLGGLNVEHGGRVHPLNDLWVYDIIKGQWSEMDYPVSGSAAVRRLSCVYESQLVVFPTLKFMWYLDVHKQASSCIWKKIATSYVTVVRERVCNGPEEYNDPLNPRRLTKYSAVHPKPSDRSAEKERRRQKSPSPKEAKVIVSRGGMSAVWDELDMLREAVMAHQRCHQEEQEEKEKRQESLQVQEQVQQPPQTQEHESNLIPVVLSRLDSCEWQLGQLRRKQVREWQERMEALKARLERVEALETANSMREEGQQRFNQIVSPDECTAVDNSDQLIEKCFPSKGNNMKRWRKLIEILKDSPAHVAEREFRSSAAHV